MHYSVLLPSSSSSSASSSSSCSEHGMSDDQVYTVSEPYASHPVPTLVCSQRLQSVSGSLKHLQSLSLT